MKQQIKKQSNFGATRRASPICAHSPRKAADGSYRQRLLAGRLKYSGKVHRRTDNVLLHLRDIRDFLTWQRRVDLVVTAQRMIDSGLSLNRSADALGVSRSWLSVATRSFAEIGAESLRPARRRRALSPADGCRLEVIVT